MFVVLDEEQSKASSSTSRENSTVHEDIEHEERRGGKEASERMSANV